MISKLFNKLFKTTEYLTTKNRRVLINNQLNIFLAIVTTIFILIFFIMGFPKLAIALLFFLILFFTAFILSLLNLANTSKFLMISSANIGIFYFASVLGKECGVHMVYFAVAWFPLILFDIKNKLPIFLGILLTIGCYLTLEISSYNTFTTVELSKETQYLYYIFYTFTTFIINMVGIFIFFSSSYLSEQKLKVALNDIQSSNEKLKLAYTDLKESREAQATLTKHAEYAKLVQRIAHEFKNPLQMLQGTVELGLKDDPGNQKFSLALQSVDRLNHIIQPMLNYLSSEQTYQFNSFNITHIINDIILLSKANCQSRKINLSLTNNLKFPYVYGDSKAIGQIFINLITNAMDAIDSANGFINISLCNEVCNYDGQAVNTVKVEVIDNGCGIDEDSLKKIFSPYETSKVNSKNVGLGLSIVSKIIDDHNGLIKVASKLNSGTTISIFLPEGKQSSVNQTNESLFNLDDAFFSS